MHGCDSKETVIFESVLIPRLSIYTDLSDVCTTRITKDLVYVYMVLIQIDWGAPVLY